MSKADSRPQSKAATKAPDQPKDEEQGQAFIEAARELGCEENLDRLDEMIRRVAKVHPKPVEPTRRTRKKDARPD